MSKVSIEDWIVAALSEEQKHPFSGAKGRSSILAAAGSGKTRTLVHLLAQDMCSGVPASGIVAFTFTDKAAGELLARIHALQNREMPTVDLSGIFIGTIHSWCLQHLYEQPDFYNVTPIDELHLSALVGRLYDFLDLERIYNKPFPKGIDSFLTDVEIFYNEHLPLSETPQSIRPAIASFLEILLENRLLTFGGMIRSSIECLESSGPLAELQSLYVDEYQDVNPAQTALIKAMIPSSGQLRVVGDDLQSIYNWRGSDVTRILDFSDEFRPAEVYRLSTNYRSRPEIVTIANGVAEDISVRDSRKIMQSNRKKCEHKVVHWISMDGKINQAETISEIVKRFHDTGVPYSEIAILLRSVTRAGRPIYENLVSNNIPVECPLLSRGGFFIDAFLIPVMEWLCDDQLEPKSRQEEEEQEVRANSLWSLVAPWLSIENAEHFFWSELNHWHDLLREGESSSYNVRKCLYHFLDSCGIHTTPSDADLMSGIGIASQIIRRVEEIHRRRITGHARRSAIGLIRESRYALIRHKEDFGESLPINQSGEGVILTTVHQAKGLEWPIVILPMLNKRRFPLDNRAARSSFPPPIADRYGTRLDDERRLFYVAVTRARERLFMFDTAARDKKNQSIFLTGLENKGLLPTEGLSELSDPTWSIPEDDLQNSDKSPIRISLSDLLLYIECPYQYGLRRVAGFQPAVDDELGFGKGLHELLQRRANDDNAWGEEEVADQADKNIHLPLASYGNEQQAKRAIAERIINLERLDAFAGKFLQEMPIEVFLQNGVVTGIIDFAYTHSNGALVVRDWKANVHADFMPRYSRQLQIYVHALRLQEQTVEKAELVDVAASLREKELFTVDIHIDNDTISQLVEKCQHALQGIQEGMFVPQPSASTCGICDVRQLCAVREERIA